MEWFALDTHWLVQVRTILVSVRALLDLNNAKILPNRKRRWSSGAAYCASKTLAQQWHPGTVNRFQATGRKSRDLPWFGWVCLVFSKSLYPETDGPSIFLSPLIPVPASRIGAKLHQALLLNTEVV